MKTQKETITQEAYRLLKDIPNKLWFIGGFTNYKDKCCALGHLNRLKSDNPKSFDREECIGDYGKTGIFSTDFDEKVTEYLQKITNKRYGIAYINDNIGVLNYKQKTIKGRILAFIKDMIKAGY